jgi:L-Ala-D/L-Glu epimerase
MQIEAGEEIWPLKQPFRISRGSRTEARVVVVSVSDDGCTGRGEGVPIRRYRQTSESVLAQLESMKNASSLDRQQLRRLLPAGAARNALDCALWDLEAKISGKRVWELANIPRTGKIGTSFTISLGSPAEMAATAKENATAPILKLKLSGDELDLARVEAVRVAAPATRLIIDANESWTSDHYHKVTPSLRELGVEVIEQPFPAECDDILETLEHPVAVCADESCHTAADLARLINRYEMINVKLDKTGGLTEALVLAEHACAEGFKLLVGCMACTSLGIAPARLLASAADYADLDGPLLLRRDRDHALVYENGRIGLPSRQLWG